MAWGGCGAVGKCEPGVLPVPRWCFPFLHLLLHLLNEAALPAKAGRVTAPKQHQGKWTAGGNALAHGLEGPAYTKERTEQSWLLRQCRIKPIKAALQLTWRLHPTLFPISCSKPFWWVPVGLEGAGEPSSMVVALS